MSFNRDAQDGQDFWEKNEYPISNKECPTDEGKTEYIWITNEYPISNTECPTDEGKTEYIE